MVWLAMSIVLQLQPSVVFETFPEILISSKIPDVLNEVLIPIFCSTIVYDLSIYQCLSSVISVKSTIRWP